jgi:hypothetical protein
MRCQNGYQVSFHTTDLHGRGGEREAIPREFKKAFLRFAGPVGEETDFYVVNDFLTPDFILARVRAVCVKRSQLFLGGRPQTVRRGEIDAACMTETDM